MMLYPTYLAHVLHRWLHTSDILHSLQRQLEISTSHQSAHILEPNRRLVHTLSVSYQSIQTFNFLVFLIQFLHMLVLLFFKLIFEFKNLVLEVVRLLSVFMLFFFNLDFELLWHIL